DTVALDQFRMLDGRSLADHETEQSQNGHSTHQWVPIGSIADFPLDGGATIKYGRSQIAVFNFASRGPWCACQHMCPHNKAFVRSGGILGDAAGMPKVACPLHKRTFSLETGQSMTGEEYHVQTFAVKVEDEAVYMHLPPTAELDKRLATEIGCKLATLCHGA